jgi:hypothetical protein
LETFCTPPIDLKSSSTGNAPDDNGAKGGTSIKTSGDDIVILKNISRYY